MPECLTVCIIPKPSQAIDVVTRWAKWGMVSNAIVCSLDDLIQNGSESICQHFSRSSVSEVSLETVLYRQSKKTELVLTALRPELPDDEEHYQREVDAAEMIKRKWHRDAQPQRITVSISREGMSLEAFTNLWDMHLVLDRHSLILPAAIVPLAEEDSVAACALAALCAGGGLTLSHDSVLKAAADDASPDGQLGKLRLVRPELRAVVSTVSPGFRDQLRAVTSEGFPEHPPWPDPSNITTIRLSTEIKPPDSLVKQLAELCGFVVAAPRFGPKFDLEGWRNAHSIIRVSFNRVFGDPEEYLREWQERIWDEEVGEYEGPSEDGTGGFETDNLEDALERFGRYVRDIEEVIGAASALSSKRWDDFDFDAAVSGLRDAEMPELTLGMQHQSSRWPACWSNMRRLCFALLDGSEFPEGIDDLPPPANASGVERLIWNDPAIVAPHPDTDSEVFQLPDDDDDLAPLLEPGTKRGTILPMDPLRWHRADRLICGAKDPFTATYDNDNRYASIERPRDCLASWREWNDELGTSLMVRLSRRLGEAVGSAYQNLANSLRPPDDEDEEGELLHALTRFRSIGIVSIPASLCLLIVGIMLLLAGVLFAEGQQLLSVILVLAWILVTVAAGSTLQKQVRSTQRYAYAVSERWRWAMSVRHYALELTRLHGVARAFADHQATVRAMLHEPFPRHKPQAGDEARDEDRRPMSLVLIATAALDEDRWVQEFERIRGLIVSEGWLETAFNAVKKVWEEEFAKLIGTDDFLDPENDYTPPGDTRYRGFSNGKPLSGSREHFRAAVANNTALRIDARVRTAMKYAGIDEEQELKLLGAVKVPQYPVIGETATAFLKFEEVRNVNFAMDIMRPGVDAIIDRENCVGSGGNPMKLEGPSSYGSGPSFAAWRMLVSSPLDPKDLRGLAPESSGFDHEDQEDDTHADVV